jgi:hypothetical protein
MASAGAMAFRCCAAAISWGADSVCRPIYRSRHQRQRTTVTRSTALLGMGARSAENVTLAVPPPAWTLASLVPAELASAPHPG